MTVSRAVSPSPRRFSAVLLMKSPMELTPPGALG